MLWLPVNGLAQSDEEKARAQLKQLQANIARISGEIFSEKEEKNSLQKQLRDVEISLGKLQQNIGENQSELKKARTELVELEKKRDALTLARDKQQESIARELKSAYQMGRQGSVKVLLNQQEPDTVARMMAYHRYILGARSKTIDAYQKTLDEITAIKPRISSLTQQLTDTARTLAKQSEKLNIAQRRRATALANLAKSIQSKGGRLKQFEVDRTELENLLNAIEVTVVNLEVPDNYKAFSAAKGKMPWPVSGKKPSNRYGKYRIEGKMRWQGVSIPARQGTSVTSIHHGRVVFADWLRGSGLLLIIDHGDGYMSLYAHNQTLLKEVGEWVTAGTPVSTVGSSGGQDSAALYFEIRHNGKPTNPGSWCRT